MSELPVHDKNIRWADWMTAIILVVILQIASARLVATQWTKDLRIIQSITFLGTILGLLLGKSIFRRFWVIFFAVSYGVTIIPYRIGLTLDPEITWNERLVNLWGRLGVVVTELFTRKPVTDNLLFLLLMAILFWVLAIHAGFNLLRGGNPWKVVIPGGITAFVIHSFDPLLVSRSWYLAFYLFFSLILIARMVYLQNTAKWKARRAHTPPDMGFDFSRMTLLFTMILVFFAWNMPVLAETFKPAAQVWQTTTRPWLTTKDRFGFMFASLRASVGLVKNFYGETLALGIGTPLSDEIVMEVEAPTELPNSYRFYWEARNYSTYRDSRWTSAPKSTRELTPDSEDLNQPGKDIRPIVSTTFHPYAPISNLYAPPEPLWFNISTKASMDVNPDGTVNYESTLSKDFVRPGEQYTVKSAIDAVTVLELTNTDTNYPQWVIDEYLQVPDEITPRTRELANEIGAGLTNPYDIASAVTNYLRNNIEYNLSISQPPPNQERIDWFLFDYRKGFCNYYASAEVILLRILGVPARMAVGFAQGERVIPPIQQIPESEDSSPQGLVSETSNYIVRQKNAHAWPEVYFPGVGWVIFEPTVAQPELFRPSGEVFSSDNQEQQQQNEEDLANQQSVDHADGQNMADQVKDRNVGPKVNFWTLSNIIKLGLLLFSVMVLVIVIWRVRRGFMLIPFLERMSADIPAGLERGLRSVGIKPPDFLVNWNYYLKLPQLSRSYLEINRALKRAGKVPAPQDTPAERTASLARTVPSASIPAEELLVEYQTSVYSPFQANVEVGRRAGKEVRRQSWLAWLRQVFARFQEPDQNR